MAIKREEFATASLDGTFSERDLMLAASPYEHEPAGDGRAEWGR